MIVWLVIALSVALGHNTTDLTGHLEACDLQCRPGAVCQMSPDGVPTCVCRARPCPLSPVCGSDGVSYQSTCQLEFLSCQSGQDVVAVGPGQCSDLNSFLRLVWSRFLLLVGGSGTTPSQPPQPPGPPGPPPPPGPPSPPAQICGNITCLFNAACQMASDGSNPRCVCPETMCAAFFQPICGSDGHTYSNLCMMEIERCQRQTAIERVHEGECASPPPTPSPCAHLRCGWGAHCQEQPDGTAFCQCPQACPDIFAPVCGSDGVTYSNECEMTKAACIHQHDITLVTQGECSLCTGHPCLFGALCHEFNATRYCECPLRRCTTDYQPMCSTAGTFNNDCLLSIAMCEAQGNITKRYDGPCQIDRPCHGNEECGSGYYCDHLNFCVPFQAANATCNAQMRCQPGLVCVDNDPSDQASDGVCRPSENGDGPLSCQECLMTNGVACHVHGVEWCFRSLNGIRDCDGGTSITTCGNEPPPPSPCSDVAKQCPDGSFVAMIPPECHWALCPGEKRGIHFVNSTVTARETDRTLRVELFREIGDGPKTLLRAFVELIIKPGSAVAGRDFDVFAETESTGGGTGASHEGTTRPGTNRPSSSHHHLYGEGVNADPNGTRNPNAPTNDGAAQDETGPNRGTRPDDNGAAPAPPVPHPNPDDCDNEEVITEGARLGQIRRRVCWSVGESGPKSIHFKLRLNPRAENIKEFDVEILRAVGDIVANPSFTHVIILDNHPIIVLQFRLKRLDDPTATALRGALAAYLKIPVERLYLQSAIPSPQGIDVTIHIISSDKGPDTSELASRLIELINNPSNMDGSNNGWQIDPESKATSMILGGGQATPPTTTTTDHVKFPTAGIVLIVMVGVALIAFAGFCYYRQRKSFVELLEHTAEPDNGRGVMEGRPISDDPVPIVANDPISPLEFVESSTITNDSDTVVTVHPSKGK